MVKQQRQQRIPVGAIAAITTVAVAAGGGAAWWHWHSSQEVQTTPPSGITQQSSPPPTVEFKAEQKVQVFWLADTGERQKLVPKTITTTAEQPSSVLETAFNDLLAGPKDTSVSTTIPAGTKLRSLKVNPDGIHIDLSQEFTNGGGSAAMIGRVAQVVYTATSLQPSDRVWIEVEGKPLEVLSGEGLELEQPLTRQSFQENFTL
ncbi:MAG TPA: spore germination protein [Cyanobacteria bacterium UBA11049]|nr:spore germination protein [Cyanobacteria bacterium UBA11049]